MKRLYKNLVGGLASLVLFAGLSCNNSSPTTSKINQALKSVKSTETILKEECNKLDPTDYKPDYYKKCILPGSGSYLREICCYYYNPELAVEIRFEDINGGRDEIIIKSTLGCISSGDKEDCIYHIHPYENNGFYVDLLGTNFTSLSISPHKTNGYHDLDVTVYSRRDKPEPRTYVYKEKNGFWGYVRDEKYVLDK